MCVFNSNYQYQGGCSLLEFWLQVALMGLSLPRVAGRVLVKGTLGGSECHSRAAMTADRCFLGRSDSPSLWHSAGCKSNCSTHPLRNAQLLLVPTGKILNFLACLARPWRSSFCWHRSCVSWPSPGHCAFQPGWHTFISTHTPRGFPRRVPLGKIRAHGICT